MFPASDLQRYDQCFSRGYSRFVTQQNVPGWPEPAGCITRISLDALQLRILAASATIRNRFARLYRSSRTVISRPNRRGRKEERKQRKWKCKYDLIDVGGRINSGKICASVKSERKNRKKTKRRWCRSLSIPFPAFYDTVLHHGSNSFQWICIWTRESSQPLSFLASFFQLYFTAVGSFDNFYLIAR